MSFLSYKNQKSKFLNINLEKQQRGNAEDFEEDFSDLDKKNHVLSSTVPFGKIELDLNKLFYQNISVLNAINGNKII